MRTSTNRVEYYSVVVFGGSIGAIKKAKAFFKKNGATLISTGQSSVGLKSVCCSDVDNLKKIASHLGLNSITCHSRSDVESVPRANRKKDRRITATTLNLTPKKWYYAEALEDRYPFVYVRAGEDQVWDVDLLAPNNSLPNRTRLDSQKLSQFGLRPATADDFDSFDMPIPFSKFLVQGEVNIYPTDPDVKNIKAFVKEAAPQVEPVNTDAVRDFVALLDTQLADWEPTEAGHYSANVEDLETAQYVNKLVSEWAKVHKFPQRDASEKGNKQYWTYSTPGYGKEEPVVKVAVEKTNDDDEAVGPWMVTISPLWNMKEVR